ncbi:MAG TPA: alpha/beta hydrolase [Rubrobacteraceae bacterium]|nr:alpha/beta hydrolase [Rubrobacteraceae bacterium]
MSPLAYLEAGGGEQPVLLIHGNFAGKSWWREVLAGPVPNARLLAPDLPGFGESTGVRGFSPSMSRYAESLVRFLDGMGVRRPVLVGHSFGAAVAVELALTSPERFPAMLLLSPTPLDGLYTPEYLYPVLQSYRFDWHGLRQSLQYVMSPCNPSYLDDLVDEARKMHPANFTGNARILAEWRVNGKARLYGGPVLVASGQRDNLISPYSAQATARAFHAGKYVSLGNVGHSPQIEAPEKVLSLLDVLLDLTEGDASL